jgi:hypothetical protein
MNTALEDELIRGNPCRIKGANTYQHAERLTLPGPLFPRS